MGVLVGILEGYRRSDAAMADVSNLRAGVVQIGRGAKSEQRTLANRLQVSHSFHQMVLVGNSGNAVQYRLERSRTLGADSRLLPAGLVHVADLLHHPFSRVIA